MERAAAISNRPVEEVARAAQVFGQEDEITALSVRWTGMAAEAELMAAEPATTSS